MTLFTDIASSREPIRFRLTALTLTVNDAEYPTPNTRARRAFARRLLFGIMMEVHGLAPLEVQ
jgi:hypothetical protein